MKPTYLIAYAGDTLEREGKGADSLSRCVPETELHRVSFLDRFRLSGREQKGTAASSKGDR